jgi:two-component system, sporulation sensor kinase E
MLNKFSASAKLYLLIFITAASLIGLGLYGINDLKQMNENTRTLYADRVLCMQQLANIRFAYITEIFPAAQKVKNHLLTFSEAKKRVQKAEDVINTNWHSYKQSYFTPEELFLVKQTDVIKNQADEATEELKSVLSKEDPRALDGLIQKDFAAEPGPFVMQITHLMQLQVRVGKDILNKNKEIYHIASKKFILLILLSLVIALSLSFYIIKNVKGLIRGILKRNNTIKESEEKYQSLFEQASDAIYVLNAKGNFTNVNNSMCELVGYTSDELLTMNIADLLNTELLKANALLYLTAKSGQVVIGERKVIHKDGSIIDVEINGKKFDDDRVLVIARDISKRKEMEAELRQAELKFRTLADKSMVGIYIVQKGIFVYVNPRFAEVFGYEPHELIGKPPVEAVIHPDYHAISDENVRLRVDGEVEGVHYEAMGRRKDGSANWVEFYGNRAVFEDEPTIIGSMIDITERKKAEDELRVSEQKYKTLFDSSPMALLMAAKSDLSIIAANDEATTLYGYTNEELLKMTIKDLRREEDRDQVWDNFKVDLDVSSDRGIFRHVKKDGTIIFVQVIAHDIIFEGKQVRLGLYNDLTEKIKAEQVLQKTEANLQTILNTTDTAYALLDRNLDVLEYNDKALAFAKNEFNFHPENGGKLFDHLPESRRSQFFENIDNVLKGNTISYEVNYPQHEEMDIWYHVRMFPIANKENEILGLVLAITDITERKDAEQSLQLAYERIKTHIQFIREMIWKQSHILRSPLANLKGLMTILRNNPADKEVLGYIEIELDRIDSVFMEMAKDSSKEEMNY